MLPANIIKEAMEKLFTKEIQMRMVELPADEQLWLSDELYLMAELLRRTALKNKKRRMPQYASYPQRYWRN